MSSFDPHQYWNDRLRDEFTLDGVGWLGMSESFNRWMYRVRRRVFISEMRRTLGRRRDISVLDVGSGTGMYVELWQALGVKGIVASDFSEVAVGNLRSRQPQVPVVQFDVTAPTLPPELSERTFDVVSAMDMLFHIVDDDAYQRAIENLVGLLKPGGLLVFTENFLRDRTDRAKHQVSRSAAQIDALVSAAGGSPVRCRPTFLLMNTPVDSDSRLLHLWWDQLSVMAHRGPRIANWAGALIFPIELAGLMVVRRGGPSTKLAIWRKHG